MLPSSVRRKNASNHQPSASASSTKSSAGAAAASDAIARASNSSPLSPPSTQQFHYNNNKRALNQANSATIHSNAQESPNSFRFLLVVLILVLSLELLLGLYWIMSASAEEPLDVGGSRTNDFPSFLAESRNFDTDSPLPSSTHEDHHQALGQVSSDDPSSYLYSSKQQQQPQQHSSKSKKKPKTKAVTQWVTNHITWSNHLNVKQEKSREHSLLVQMWNQQQINKYPYLLRRETSRRRKKASSTRAPAQDDQELDDVESFYPSQTQQESVEAERAQSAISAAQRFSPYRDCIPIVLYVHNRPEYFLKVIRALSKNTRIHETLIIVSHDGLYPEMIEIVRRELTFCAWIELIHPRTYEFSTGVMRLTYHWWWLQEQVWHNFIFDNAIFLEEDHLVSPDFYVSALFLRHIHRRIDPELEFTVGFSLYNQWSADPAHEVNHYRLLLRNHAGRQDNTAYCYSRKLWNTVIEPKKEFYYSWNDQLRSMKGRVFGWDVVLKRILKDHTDSKVAENDEREANWWIVPAFSRARNIGLQGLHSFKEFEKPIPISEHTQDLWEQKYSWEPQSLDILRAWNSADAA